MLSLGPQRIPLLAAGTITASGTGTSAPVDVHGADELTFYFTSVSTTSGGTILIEEADYSPVGPNVYAGTWSLIATIAASSFTGGAQIAYHLPQGAYSYVRARVSADISGGGSISVVLKMQ